MVADVGSFIGGVPSFAAIKGVFKVVDCYERLLLIQDHRYHIKTCLAFVMPVGQEVITGNFSQLPLFPAVDRFKRRSILLVEAVRVRPSREGNFVSVTASFLCPTRAKYDEIHAALRAHPDVRWTL